MSYLKLIKLMYVADRKAIVELGRPITYDRFVSMPQGPVLSATYDLIRFAREGSYWRTYISAPSDYEVQLLVEEPPRDKLSRAEEAIIRTVFTEHGARGRYDLRDFTHTFPEWHDPDGSSRSISLREMLIGQCMSEDDATAVEEALIAETKLNSLLG